MDAGRSEYCFPDLHYTGICEGFAQFTDFVFLHVIIIQQTSKSGGLNSIFLSNRPGLVKAGSRVSGLQNNNNMFLCFIPL